MARSKGIKFICDVCGELVELGRPRYIFKGELYCSYDGGDFDESVETSNRNIRMEIQQLIEIAERKTEKELNDEVYYNFQMDLCSNCRSKFYEQIEHSSSANSNK